jgi:phosphoribosylformimino-5-aminoimidazole carboxamide ribotide isomerase
MKFRPCIDIHEGVVKQIVGSTLSEDGQSKDDKLIENFVSKISSKDYASMYKNDQLVGGHIIMLGNNCEKAAFDALNEYPNGLQVGGGITIENAQLYLNAGASHVIVTSYVFRDGNIDFERLENLVSLIGKERLVLDLSCRRKIDDLNG